MRIKNITIIWNYIIRHKKGCHATSPKFYGLKETHNTTLLNNNIYKKFVKRLNKKNLIIVNNKNK